MEEPILVSGTDGVGQDCVAMCVNDIICCGAKPLFFLDYMSLWKNIPELVATIVSGVAGGCKMAGCALVGGETAEMPGLYSDNEYDLAGFSVGMVDKKKMINPAQIKIGDVVIGLASSGVHSNGFSLIRKVFKINKDNIKEYKEELGKTLGEELLTPTKIYVKSILSLIEQVEVKGISHITGGGFYENMPRMLKEGVALSINKDTYEIPTIFKLIQKQGNIPVRDMYNTFNMGIGMAVIVSKEEAEKALQILKQAGETAYVIGKVVEGNKDININL